MDNKNNHVKNNNPPPDGGYGWIIVLATTLMNITLLTLVQNFGIIFNAEFKAAGITAAQTSFLLHLHGAIFCSLGFFAGPLLKKYNFQNVAFLGTALMCTGIFLTSFATSYPLLICTVSVLVGVGQGVLLPATYVAVNTYFKKRLTLAMSLSVTGASISSVFMPQVCQKLIGYFNRTQTVLVLSAISLTALVSCFLLRPIKHVIDKEQIQALEILQVDDGKTENEKVVAEEETQTNPTSDKLANEQVYNETTLPLEQNGLWEKICKLFDLELLKQSPYVVAIVGMSVSFASELNLILMIPFILVELANFTNEDVALVASIQSIADLIGRLFVPIGGHYLNVPPQVMYAGSLLTSTLGRTVIAIFFNSRATILFCAVLLGLGKGTKAVYQSVIIPKYVTLDKLPGANGLNMLLTGALSLIIGPIIGAIHDYANSYVPALHAGSFLSISCVLLWIIFYFSYTKSKGKTEKEFKF